MKKASFPILGMHCASCARLIERKLTRTTGVISANVNYGSEMATVEYDENGTSEEKLAKSVKETGYELVHQSGEHDKSIDEIKEEAKKKELEKLKLKVIISGILSILILIGSFININPLILMVLTLPVLFWAGWSFFQATISGLKNRTASMDTLISVG